MMTFRMTENKKRKEGEYGHDYIRLPAYHADLNSIELIWATMRGYIARRNVSFKMTHVIQLTHDAIAAVCFQLQACGGSREEVLGC